MRRSVFYSWQSDLPATDNRNLIEASLQKAIRAIGRDKDAGIDPTVDRDTANISGTPDIAHSILDKIARADVFVADVSIINTGELRLTPNPNVLIELGYAIAELGWNNIILVQNKAFGGPELLPFDLRGRRTIVYEVNRTDGRAEARGLLQGRLETALRAALSASSVENLPSGLKTNLWFGKWAFNIAQVAGGYLLIREVGPRGFVFDLEVSHGAHIGFVTASARFVSNDLAYCRLPNGPTDSEGELVFRRSMESDVRIIEIEETASCSFYRGIRANFSGRYVREREPWFDAGYMNEIEIARLYILMGEHFDKMRACTGDIVEIENADQIEARVISGGVAGLYTIRESIVMFNKAGEVWAAYLDDETVRYFTNVPSYRAKLPETFSLWRSRFLDSPVIYCEAVVVVPKRKM